MHKRDNSKEPENKHQTPENPVKSEKPEKSEAPKKSKKIKFYPENKKLYLTLFSVFVALLIASACYFYFTLNHIFSLHAKYDLTSEEKTYIYDNLTGEIIEDESLNSSPIFCIQIPNGMDGARPQAGLNEASIIFEAIAESGITRFAAIFKNPSVSAIGPIRSLRIYYLNWDVPFNCAVTHAGGASDALAALSAGDYRDLTENYTYMYRGQKNSTLTRRWNNLFTTSKNLETYSSDKNYTTSSPKSFARLTPRDSEIERELLDEKIADYEAYLKNPENYKDPIEPAKLVTSIKFRFGNMQNFNPVYTYDKETNAYLRSYESGLLHETYVCPEDLNQPTPELACGKPVQVAPSVVIAMIVEERRAADGVHEAITNLGSGKAYVFQNGTVIEGTWNKSTKEDQITFLDEKGEEIKLAPGQTWISAIPTYGSVFYE